MKDFTCIMHNIRGYIAIKCNATSAAEAVLVVREEAQRITGTDHSGCVAVIDGHPIIAMAEELKPKPYAIYAGSTRVSEMDTLEKVKAELKEWTEGCTFVYIIHAGKRTKIAVDDLSINPVE